MGFTTSELEEFYRFAHVQLGHGEVEISLEECLHRWRLEQQEAFDSVAAIRESTAKKRQDSCSIRPELTGKSTPAAQSSRGALKVATRQDRSDVPLVRSLSVVVAEIRARLK